MVSSVSGSIASSLGIGSGIDTAALIDKLAEASRAPREAAIKAKEDLNLAQISAVGQASGAISSFSTALSQLIGGGSLFTQPTVSDTAVLNATALSGARIGTLATQLEVRQLAQAQSLVSENLTDINAAIGKGSLTLATRTGSFAITIDDSNNNLIGLARAINLAGSGVTASIIEDSGGARLTLKSATGAAQAFTIEAAADAEPALTRFNYDPAVTGGMTRAQQAQDALLRLDGVDVARSSNTITDLIDGVKLDLKTAKPDVPVSLGAQRPTTAIRQAVSDIVDTYNALKLTLDELTAPATGSTPAGPLKGDTSIRTMRAQLARLTATVLASGGSYSTLAEIGVSTLRDGTLAVDTSRLDTALATDPDAVEALFNPGQTSSNPLVKITSLYGRAKPGTYTITDLVPGDATTPASGTIAGKPAIGAANRLVASVTSAASGLTIEPLGNVGSATVTIDLGLAGALKSISDLMTSSNGAFAISKTRLAAVSKQLVKDRAAMETRESAYLKQITQQFTVMNKQVSVFKATQSYLEQQVALWTKSN